MTSPWMPKETDFEVVSVTDGFWTVIPHSTRAKNWNPRPIIKAQGVDQYVVWLRASGYVVYDPKNFYRNARPLTGVVINDRFSKD